MARHVLCRFSFLAEFLGRIIEVWGQGILSRVVITVDRWNARDIAEYWRLWNIPVHHWCKRHIFKPLVQKYQVSPSVAIISVFTFSAIVHEIIFGIPTHNLTGIAFLGMLGQIPLIILTNYMNSFKTNHSETTDKKYDTLGNLIFWISFTVVGQPACTLLYYHEWSKMSALAN